VAQPLINFLAKNIHFDFDEIYVGAFEKLQSLLISGFIVQSPNFSIPLEINVMHLTLLWGSFALKSEKYLR